MTQYCMMQAASEAYDATLAPVHTYFVRTAVKASLYLLPDRATFLNSIGETGAVSSEVSAWSSLQNILCWAHSNPS